MMQVFFPSFPFATLKTSKEYRSNGSTPRNGRSKTRKSLNGSHLITLDLDLKTQRKEEWSRQRQQKKNAYLHGLLFASQKKISNRKLMNSLSRKNEQNFMVENKQITKLRAVPNIKISKSINQQQKNKLRYEKQIASNKFLITKKAQTLQQKRPKTQRMHKYSKSNNTQRKKHTSQTVYQINQTDYRPWSPVKPSEVFLQTFDF